MKLALIRERQKLWMDRVIQAYGLEFAEELKKQAAVWFPFEWKVSKNRNENNLSKNHNEVNMYLVHAFSERREFAKIMCPKDNIAESDIDLSNAKSYEECRLVERNDPQYLGGTAGFGDLINKQFDDGALGRRFHKWPREKNGKRNDRVSVQVSILIVFNQ